VCVAAPLQQQNFDTISEITAEIYGVSELRQQQNQSTIGPRNFSKETTVSPFIFSSFSNSSWSNDCSRGGFGRNILSSVKSRPYRRCKDTFTNIHQPHEHQCGCHS